MAEDDLDDIIDRTNIIPRSKRRAALASGLASSTTRQSLPSSSYIDSDDEEGDF